MDLKGAVAVVTGGTGTIGGVIASRLAAEGAEVVLWDRDVSSTSTTAIACDVADPTSVEKAMTATVDRFAVPHILVNAAGLSGGMAQRAAEATTDDQWASVLTANEVWELVFSVNVLGVVNTSRVFAREIAKQRNTDADGVRGAIVNITSISGQQLADPALAAYSASKSAVHMITRIAAADFGPLGIQVNAVAPGLMETRMKPMPSAPGIVPPASASNELARAAAGTPLGGRAVRPSDIADAVAAMLSTDFVTGQILAVEGGITQRSLTRSSA